jgi:hypothetical protein
MARFEPMTPEQLNALSTLWQTSRILCRSRFERINWTVKEFQKAHPEVSSVFKNLDRFVVNYTIHPDDPRYKSKQAAFDY